MSAQLASPPIRSTQLLIECTLPGAVAGAAAGVVIAAIVRRRRPFVIITGAATALSLVPALFAPDDVSASVVLVVAHLIAAAIVIPALVRHLPSRGGTSARL